MLRVLLSCQLQAASIQVGDAGIFGGRAFEARREDLSMRGRGRGMEVPVRRASGSGLSGFNTTGLHARLGILARVDGYKPRWVAGRVQWGQGQGRDFQPCKHPNPSPGYPGYCALLAGDMCSRNYCRLLLLT